VRVVGKVAIGVLLLTCGLSACGRRRGNQVGQPDAGAAGSGAGGAAGVAADSDAARTNDDADGAEVGELDGAVPPTVDDPGIVTCTGRFPPPFVTYCGGCHTTSGQSNPRYPDLYAFAGDEAAFLKAARMGRPGMASFPATLVSDGDLKAALAAFKAQARPILDVPAPPLDAAPLFPTASAVPAIVSLRADGVLVTRGAGRLRSRRETEVPHSEYMPHYTERRDYAFFIEDFTPTGQAHIRVTYLPSYQPTTTGFHAWKLVANNLVFGFNSNLVAVAAPPAALTYPFTAAQQYDQTSVPVGRTMARGELFEFAFSAVGSQLPPPPAAGHSDTFRYRIGVGGLTAENRNLESMPGPLLPAQLGGDATITWVFQQPTLYFSQMALNMQPENVQGFLQGHRLFHNSFATGESSEATEQPILAQHVGQAGPTFNAASCDGCHAGNGAGVMLAKSGIDTAATSMVFRLPAGAALGRQLQPQEGASVATSTTTKVVTLADGKTVTLTRPFYRVTAAGAAVAQSARVAPALVGLGLLEAIDEGTLALRADPEDCDRDGISGRSSVVKDAAGARRIGRFGWKAERADLPAQVAEDSVESVGLATAASAGPGGAVELTDDELAKLATYVRLGGVPPQRNAADPGVVAGEQLFHALGCVGCHVSDVLTSGNHPLAELRRQAIRPFTDLLLHDMGPDLADDSGTLVAREPDAPPAASEWRTPPLWGIGLRAQVNGHGDLLHDGRAKTIEEAVLWHGGEAKNARDRYVGLGAAERAALLAFLSSL
jgi:CxxC motif-containing protein (DUF1111 family)